MGRIFITGSADGLGQMAASALIAQGHTVTLHARNEKRTREVSMKVRGADAVLTADLSSMEETKKLAADINSIGHFDAIIHNAGVYQVSNNALSVEGLPVLLAVNTIAPYILTCLIHPPQRLIYLTSGLHSQGDAGLHGLQRNKLRIGYPDSKLHDLILCKAVARRWPDVRSNAVNPGWVPTKMGGPGATDDLEEGYQTQVWLAVSDDEKAQVSGRYFYHRREARYLPAADDVTIQEKFLALCEQISGIPFPAERLGP
ncbi:SDR family NAD(P)-dependent oxidoreductase [Puia dinghuensis]|uniref:Short-chain dehydrogenase n=1 Tax=Puia dinghuensis TaxID=1792502 RepID=A0A8J2UDQ0_9BACT|nr:SDR family NAD(P)-dependent oxidoreductase [Puia dinghuensis]GGB02160.1 short-chain dehydrogenase [Puia dinghuensis]